MIPIYNNINKRFKISKGSIGKGFRELAIGINVDPISVHLNFILWRYYFIIRISRLNPVTLDLLNQKKIIKQEALWLTALNVKNLGTIINPQRWYTVSTVKDSDITRTTNPKRLSATLIPM